MYGQGGTPGIRQTPPSAGTAKTLILIGLILQAIIAFVFLAFALALGSIFLGLGLLFLPFALVGLLFIYLVYALCYKRTKEGNYEGARTPTLVIGIISLIFGGVISGILYIVAWVKLGDAIQEMNRAAAPPPTYVPVAVPVYQPAPAGAPAQAPTAPGTAPAAAPVCPRCGRPATFVAQYNRYYCYTDQQYL